MSIYGKLKECNLILPEAPAKDGLYTPCMEFGENLAYISGCGLATGDKEPCGKLGKEYTTEEGMEWARNSTLSVLVVLEAQVGDLNKVKKVVKILVLAANDDEFTEQPMMANGVSALLGELFGTENLPSRSVIGVNVLPGNTPVEIEAIFELEK